jgi:hypothetical protein
MANSSIELCVMQGRLLPKLSDCSTLPSLCASTGFPTSVSSGLQSKVLQTGFSAYVHVLRRVKDIQQPSWLEILAILALCMVIYLSSLVVHRLYLSPVAAFPGPFLARTTHWYEFYYTYIQTGMYYKKVAEFHAKYGKLNRSQMIQHPIDEARFRSSGARHPRRDTRDGSRSIPEPIRNWCGEEDRSIPKVQQWHRIRRHVHPHPQLSKKWLTDLTDMTAISTNHDAHRRLRMPLEKLFARHSILRIEPRVISRTEKLCARLESYRGSSEAVNLSNAFSSLTTDIISSVIFEEPSDYLSDPDFNDEWYQTLKMGTVSVPLLKHMPWITR